MVDLYEGPSREGTRGGLEQFTWESIKAQGTRDRECYLGREQKCVCISRKDKLESVSAYIVLRVRAERSRRNTREVWAVFNQ